MQTFMQIGIAVLGATAVYLIGDERCSRRKAGYICGLCSQPLWFATTISHEQYGITVLCVWYTLAYIRGIRNHVKK